MVLLRYGAIMTTIQTHAYVGTDGVLTLRLPVNQREQQVQVVVVVQSEAAEDVVPVGWDRELLDRLSAAGARLPRKVDWSHSIPPVHTVGLPASQTLVDDRR